VTKSGLLSGAMTTPTTVTTPNTALDTWLD